MADSQSYGHVEDDIFAAFQICELHTSAGKHLWAAL
jgi:hypothetical protein